MLYGYEKDAPLKFGLYTLGEHMPNPHTGELQSEKERIHEIIETAKISDELGLDFFGLGESHQEHFVSQAHAVILGAIAQETKNIQIGSASTIISTSDPIRVYENFATLDLISNGRAEIIAGRGSRVGLFELLGYDVDHYEELYDEHFKLLDMINKNEYVTWEGRFRKALNNAQVLPRAEKELPLWRAVGGGAGSAIEAGWQGVPLVLVHLAGPVDTYKYTIDSYRKYAAGAGHDVDELPLTTGALMHIGDTVEEAIAEFYPYANNGYYLANGRGFNKRAFLHEKGVDSVMAVGDKDLIVEKIHYQYETYGMQRYIAEIDFGGVPREKQLEMLETYATYIVPKLRKLTSK